ncbi:MAG TPA: xanthine dehydrogenase family protein molybdopterin-binding subunit [Bryobacteraceae bacterium]|jgi:isoquinoline 1-oxidoreductase beta subunit
MTAMTPKLNRRGFLQASAAAAGGLVINFTLPERAKAQAAGAPAKVNAFVRIGSDDSVTLMIHKSEMGQGTVTSLSQLLAEELECDWKKIRTEFPGVEPAYAGGGMMGAYGSLSIRTSYAPLRQAGAQAREMLVAAAAQKWGVNASQCRAENSSVVNTATNAKLNYGSLAEAASQLAVPANVKLKDAAQFKVIGTSPKRLDTPAKVNGSATFGLDVKRPGMLYASLERCPVFEGKVASFDATKAKAVPGVKNVVQISNGVAVIADNTWSAMEGRKALTIKWDEGPRANTSSASLRQMFMDLTAKPGAVARKVGDAGQGMAGAAKKIDAVYEAPYLSHAPMEPLNCTALVTADSCEVWAGTQIQSIASQTAAGITKLPANKIQIHTEYLGGGFGRRGGADFIGEAVEIAKAVPGTPVKLTWTREDDLQHDTYRPASYTKFAAGLDADGWPVSFTASVACPSFGGMRNGVDSTAVEGIETIEYGIPNMQVEYHAPDAGIPVSYWRSVGFSQNCFFMESFLDEMAAATKKDPVEFRRKLLAKANPRYLNVLNVAAEKANWGKPLPTGHFHGVGVVNNIGSFNALVAEVSVTGGKVKVHKVVAAVDCGQVVNPNIVTQQIESGIVYGLSAALKLGITLEKGRVVQQNFNNYEPLRISEMPVVEVHLVASTAAPGGIGEASTPSIIPAVTNAVFAATGKRIRTLPIKAADLA